MGKKKKHESPAPKKEPQRYELNKIIYFDKETIKNILQKYNKGPKQTVVNSSDSSSVAIGSNMSTTADIYSHLDANAKSEAGRAIESVLSINPESED